MKGQLKFPVRAKGMRLLDADGCVVMDSMSTIDFPVSVSELHAAEVAARLNLNHEMFEALCTIDRNDPRGQSSGGHIARAVLAKVDAIQKQAGIKPEEC